MYQLLSKRGQTFGFGLGLLVTVIFIISILSGFSEFADASEEDQMKTGIFNPGLYGVIIMSVIAAIAAIGFGLYHTITNLKGSMKGLMGIGALFAVFAIFYFTASAEPEGIVSAAVDKFQTDNGSEITSGNFKFISASINTVLALGVLGVLALIVSEVLNIFK